MQIKILREPSYHNTKLEMLSYKHIANNIQYLSV